MNWFKSNLVRAGSVWRIRINDWLLIGCWWLGIWSCWLSIWGWRLRIWCWWLSIRICWVSRLNKWISCLESSYHWVNRTGLKSCWLGLSRRECWKGSEAFVNWDWNWLLIWSKERCRELGRICLPVQKSCRRALEQQELLLIRDGSLFSKLRRIPVFRSNKM